MRVFKNKAFSKWAVREGLDDGTLLAAVEEMECGLVDADLGGHVVKKRVAIRGRGKSGGIRTLLAYKISDKAFFIYGFAKNARSNINSNDLKALKLLAKELLNYTDKDLTEAVKRGALKEVEKDG